MEDPICYIFGAGDFSGVKNHSVEKNTRNLIIAADGGFDYLSKMGMEPDYILGDFDSVRSQKDINQSDPKVYRFKSEKDETDMFLAVKLGLEKGYKRFVLYGAWGGRSDHEIANIQVLSYIAKAGGTGIIVDENCEMTVIKNSRFTIDKKTEGIISVFSLSDISKNVAICGAKYEIEGETLTNTFPLGVSNEMIGKTVTISVENGTLLIMWDIKQNL